MRMSWVVSSAAGVVLAAACGFAAFAQENIVDRGRYLMLGPVACGNCHDGRGPDGAPLPGMHLAGGFRLDELPAFDTYARNITPDVDTGIGNWTDDQIVTAIREGKTREGEAIGPPMPIFTYNNMSNDDVRAIVAYLRTVPAVHNEVPDAVYNIPKATPPPAAGNPAPARGPTAEYGGYIVNALAHCFECHTPALPNGAPDMAKMGGGGFPIHAMGIEIFTANITPDRDTGIGGWTDAEIRKAITEGIGHEGQPLFPIMPAPFFKNMTADDVTAVIAYLRSVPAVSNKVERRDWRALLGAMQAAPPR